MNPQQYYENKLKKKAFLAWKEYMKLQVRQYIKREQNNAHNKRVIEERERMMDEGTIASHALKNREHCPIAYFQLNRDEPPPSKWVLIDSKWVKK